MFSLKNNFIFIIALLACGCSTARFSDDYMEDYGFVCPEKAEKAILKGMKTEKKNGKICVKIKVDKDDASDYYLREWQKDSLPEMPEL